MTIHVDKQGNKLTVALDGRLDTMTAPELEKELDQSLGGIGELELDFKNLAYISSAGLRTILASQKRMAKQGRMVVTHVSEAVKEVFDITGFTDILTIE